MNFIREYRTYLIGAAILWAVSLVLCSVAYVFVIRPQNNSKRRLESTLAEQKQLFASAQEATQEQSRIELNGQIERLRDRLKSFAVGHEKLTDLTLDISQIGDKENLSSLSVTTRSKRSSSRHGRPADSESDTSHISENLIDINFNAEFRQFAIFVNALERHRPVLFIDEFKITRSTNNESVYQATLDVTAFVRKQQNNETADTTSTSALSAKL